ncbi:hypothetical protein Q7I36_13560, partial [Aeromonas veronii]
SGISAQSGITTLSGKKCLDLWGQIHWVDANTLTTTEAGVSSEEYRNYQVKIVVSGADFSDGTFKSCVAPCSVGKRIDLQIKLPDQSVFDFSFYRGNY